MSRSSEGTMGRLAGAGSEGTGEKTFGVTCRTRRLVATCRKLEPLRRMGGRRGVRCFVKFLAGCYLGAVACVASTTLDEVRAILNHLGRMMFKSGEANERTTHT